MSIYKGMTVNERLYVSGLIDKFDAAVKTQNIDEIINILKEVDIDEKKLIKAILKSLNLD